MSRLPEAGYGLCGRPHGLGPSGRGVHATLSQWQPAVRAVRPMLSPDVQTSIPLIIVVHTGVDTIYTGVEIAH